MAVIPEFWAGEQITIKTTYSTAAGVLTDPTAATLKYGDAAGTVTPTSVALSGMTHVSAGIYTLIVDTTGFVAGYWDFQTVATGAVATVNVAQIFMKVRPLG